MAKRVAAAEPGARDPLMIKSVEKAFRVLQAFDAANPALGLTQLAARAGLDRSSAQRFIHTLEALGHLRRDRRTRRFTLSVRALDVANRFLSTDPLANLARPYVQQLRQVTRETVNLSVLDGSDMIMVIRMVGRHALNIDATLGSRHPVFCCAPGIAMLSRLPGAEARAILNQCHRRPITAATTWQMDRLVAKLALSAKRGYATCFEEIHPGDLSVAAAITDGAGRPIGAVNVAALRSRLTPEEVERAYAPVIVDAAQSISQACAGLQS